jgi:hypothetical protein
VSSTGFTSCHPIEWRSVTLAPHAPGIWLSADRLWKVTCIGGDEHHWVAYLQLDLELQIVDSGPTAEEALGRLAIRAGHVASKLNGALDQARSSP